MNNIYIKISPSGSNNPNDVYHVPTPLPTPLEEILFMPSTGECIILKTEHVKELTEGKDENGTPNVVDDTIADIGKDDKLTEAEKAEKVNRVLFDSKKADEGTIGDIIKFTECIGLKDKKPIMVAKKFIQKMKDSRYSMQLVESNGESGEDDVFADYRIKGTATHEKENKRKVFDKELDKKLRSEYIRKFQPQLHRLQHETTLGQKGGPTDKQKAEIAKLAKDLSKELGFQSPFKEFLEGTKVELMDEWGATYSMWNGEHNWNNNKKKEAILTLLGKPKFNQDDSLQVLRDIKDLWYKENDTTAYNEVMNGITDADLLYSNKEQKAKLKNNVEKQEVPPTVFKASVSASVMRMSAKAQGSFKSDLAKGELVNASGELSADMALAEGKAEMSFMLPDKDGFNAVFKMRRKLEKKEWKELTVDSSLLHPANFHFDSSFVAPHTASGLHQQLVALERAFGAQDSKLIGIDIIGHTDARGAATYNHKLGFRRSDAVFDFFNEDYVGLAHNFQDGKWNGTHVEFMQGVVNTYKKDFTGTWGSTGNNWTFNNLAGTGKKPTLKDAILDPDSLYMVTDLKNMATLEDHHSFLKDNFPEYAANSLQPVPEANTQEVPELKKGVILVKGHNNQYILGLLKVYRQRVCARHANINFSKFIKYKEGVASKGEHQMLVETNAKNWENRRVAIKGYVQKRVSVMEDALLDFGYFRMKVQGHASGYAGANIVLSGSANINVDAESMLMKGVIADKVEPREPSKDNNEKSKAKQVEANADAEVKGEFFAGVKAEAGLKSFLFWHASQPEKKGWWELGNIGYAVNGSLGLSAEAEFKIGYDKESRRFLIKARVAATLGIGGGGTVEFSVGLGGLWRFVQYVYTQIKENDFSFVDFFDNEDAFTVYCSWYIKMLQGGVDLAIDAGEKITEAALEVASKAQEMLKGIEEMARDWKRTKQEKEEALKMVEAIENNDKMLAHATPEVKGRILYLLTQYKSDGLVDMAEDIWNRDYNHRREETAVKLIEEYIVSERDWQETFEHIAHEAKRDGKMAKPYLGDGNKGKVASGEKLKENKRRMLENETWLKTHLLNDKEDWERVKNRKTELWK